jgi:hypothetical protein
VDLLILSPAPVLHRFGSPLAPAKVRSHVATLNVRRLTARTRGRSQYRPRALSSPLLYSTQKGVSHLIRSSSQ